jgi:hypothetical protein
MAKVSASNHFAPFLDAEHLQGLVESVVGALASANSRAQEASKDAQSVSTFLRPVDFVS